MCACSTRMPRSTPPSPKWLWLASMASGHDSVARHLLQMRRGPVTQLSANGARSCLILRLSARHPICWERCQLSRNQTLKNSFCVRRQLLTSICNGTTSETSHLWIPVYYVETNSRGDEKGRQYSYEFKFGRTQVRTGIQCFPCRSIDICYLRGARRSTNFSAVQKSSLSQVSTETWTVGPAKRSKDFWLNRRGFRQYPGHSTWKCGR
jgi:hypothetical protein